MRSEQEKSKRKKPENPTLEALAPQELLEGPPIAERWILTEIKKMQQLGQIAETHRRKAMAGIAERFHQRVYRYCLAKLQSNREEAEDVVQEVFQDLEKLLERVEHEEHLRNLIFRLAKNKCADAVTRIRRVTLSDEIRSIAPEEADEEGIDPELLRRAIARLPKLEDRILLTLSLDYRMPLRAIATVLEISEGACKMRRHRARQKLRTLLEDEM